jgi:pyruvate kinase
VFDRKGVNLPDTELQGAALTAKDRADINDGISAGIDLFALSFTRTASDVHQLRALLPDHTPVIAKIERPEALVNFSEICAAADAVMVARGDLGVEVGWEALPGLQMDLVAEASDKGRLSVVATEMLESMTHANRPTRAEVADVAGAVMDGASAVMLSAETASGVDPARVVRSMGGILAGIETHTRYRSRNIDQQLGLKNHHRPAAVAAAATRLARDVDASVIVSIASSGAAARMISSARPHVPVVALCQRPEVARHLALWWGVYPRQVPVGRMQDGRIRELVREMLPEPTGPAIVVSGAVGGSYSDRLRIMDL